LRRTYDGDISYEGCDHASSSNNQGFAGYLQKALWLAHARAGPAGDDKRRNLRVAIHRAHEL
jgi:hypothetical protein